MNCDQVFDVLTRGPFPSGHKSDRAVERHLAGCPDCQRLANALRPALELFQEAIAGDEGRELPGYWGGMEECEESSVAARPLAEVAGRLPLALHRRLDEGRRWVRHQGYGNSFRFAAALLIGIGLASMVYVAGVPARQAGTDSRVAAATPSAQAPQVSSAWSAMPAERPVEWRMSFKLASACLSGTGVEWNQRSQEISVPHSNAAESKSLSLAELTRLHCCTRCHHAQAATIPLTATASVARSCEFCHR